MKKIINIILVFVLALTLSSCSKYKSSYKAVSSVTTNTTKAASMSFYSFIGTRVFKLKSKGENKLSYSVKIESGDAKAYYDNGNGKIELLSISSGENMAGSITTIVPGYLYIIFETNGKCLNGSIEFKLTQ